MPMIRICLLMLLPAITTAQELVLPDVPMRRLYTTSFDRPEHPISERHAWSHRGLDWAFVRTQRGVAMGTQSGTEGYDDSYALLSGFPPDQGAAAIVRQSPFIDRSCSHEVELLLRFSDSAHLARGYEVLLSFDGGTILFVRWNGRVGDFTVLDGGGSYPGFQDGDTFAANIVGNVITAYVNGAIVGQASDSEITAGNPGIGFFRRECGRNSDLTFSTYAAYAIR
jgi:hypothetical protein